MVVVRSEIDRDIDGGWDRQFQLRQRRLDRLHGADDVGARQPLDGENDAAMLIDPSLQRLVLRPDDRLPDIAHPDRSAVAIRDDLVVPVLRLQDLIGGLQV